MAAPPTPTPPPPTSAELDAMEAWLAAIEGHESETQDVQGQIQQIRDLLNSGAIAEAIAIWTALVYGMALLCSMLGIPCWQGYLTGGSGP